MIQPLSAGVRGVGRFPIPVELSACCLDVGTVHGALTRSERVARSWLAYYVTSEDRSSSRFRPKLAVS